MPVFVCADTGIRVCGFLEIAQVRTVAGVYAITFLAT